MTDLAGGSATDQLAALRERRVSAEELLDAHLARHHAWHDRINAVVATDLDAAAEQARRIDTDRARGRPLGPLAGLPMTVKDGFDVLGMPAVSGVPALAARADDRPDADVVAAARAAGAVVWGKTNVPAMLGDFQTFNAVYGTTRNPYDLERTPGGSSGGAAAALAAGVTPLEIGSDIGGSLRHPAHFCGVYALKPTWGTLSMRGQVPPGPGPYVEMDLGVAGPMARTAADLALLFDVLRGRPGADPGSGDGPRAVSSAGGAARVALWLDEPGLALSAEARAGVLRAAEGLRAQGVDVVEARPPLDVGRLLDCYLTLLFPLMLAGLPDRAYDQLAAGRAGAERAVAEGAGRYSQEAFVLAATASYRAVARAQVVRAGLTEALRAWFADWDAVLAPVSPVPAFGHRQSGAMPTRELEVDGTTVPYLHMLDWIALATATHAPAVAVPAGRTAGGLPVGAQLIGRWGEEVRLLGLAGLLERETGGFHPPVQ